MKCDNTSQWGAKIEQGKAIDSRQVTESVIRCDVESIDRPGITFYGLLSDKLYSAGALVYFFAFDNGKGMIVGPIQ